MKAIACIYLGTYQLIFATWKFSVLKGIKVAVWLLSDENSPKKHCIVYEWLDQ